MNIMTRCGSIDNVLIYEHYCDTKEDMANINPKYINLGSICIVVKGTNDELEIYMADSNKQWSSLGIGNGGGGSGSTIMLSDIADTDISSSLANGDVLAYDSTTEKWKNATGGSGSNVLIVTVSTHDLIHVLDKTWQEIYDALEAGIQIIVKYTFAEDIYGVGRVIECLYDADLDPHTPYQVVVGGYGNYNYKCSSASGNPEWHIGV